MAELKRQLGLFQATMYGVGLILGAGIYVLIGEAAGIAGNAVWISLAVGAIISAFTGLSYAELTSMYPKAAAEYVYVRNAFNNNFLAFIVGWLILFTAIVSASTVSLGFGGYFAGFFDSPITVSAALLIVALSFVNFYGIKESSWMNVVFTIIEVSGLAFIIYIGSTFSDTHPVNYFESSFGINGILAATALIFFAYIGFENIANIAEETKNPTRVLPRALVLSISITGVIYVLVSIAAVSVLNWQDLGASTAPLADVAGRALGSGGQISLSVIALFATTNTVLIMLVAGSRILYGMAQQRSIPPFLSSIHVRTKTPWIAVFTVMVLSATFAFVGNIVTIANISVFTIVIVFALVNLSLIWLRYKQPNAERPFKVPFSIGRFPVLPFLGIVSSISLATQFDAYVIAVGIVVIGAGVSFYLFYGRARD
jgi:APA family basic amino acid/polyamine antiporter